MISGGIEDQILLNAINIRHEIWQCPWADRNLINTTTPLTHFSVMFLITCGFQGV